MHKAMNQLQVTDEPIMEIALALGYANASNFTRAFKARAGVSPQSFRRLANSDPSVSRLH